MKKPVKISDTTQQVTVGSRADRYWTMNPFEPYYKELRPKLSLPKDLANGNNVEKITDKFGIKGIGFGNWVTVEDRLNYINAMIIAFYDLDKILKFQMNIGIYKNLSVAFGARGSSGALAHYEPDNQMINITRYERGEEKKIIRLLTTGGIGSFAHEYGHFLDYFAGWHLDQDNKIIALTGGRSTGKDRINLPGSLRSLTDDILEKIIWKVPGKTLSNYYQRLDEFVSKTKGAGTYFIRRNEIFARAFEVFVSSELKKLGIDNKFLVSTKYNPNYYLKESEIQQISPLFKKLIAGIRSKLF